MAKRDWAYQAAHAVIADLTGRRGFDFGDLDMDIRREIVATLADIIRAEHAKGASK